MKNCINIVFIFTNRYSISKKIDYYTQVLYYIIFRYYINQIN